jgi:predicted NBD/HSP70 family sugar kinase
MKFLGSNHKTAAAWNRGLAIRLLRRHGSLSRHDISHMTQLQGSTLSYIVRELIEKNVVRVVGKRQSRQVGQKQVLLTLNPEMGWMLGVSLRPGLATLVLLDTAGGRIDSTQSPLQGPIETFPAQIHQAMNFWLRHRGMPHGKMLGVGVGVPGVVDADAGVVLRSVPLHAVNIPLQKLFADEFGVTSVVDHDACYGACSEATDGAAADVSHFIYFSVNTAATPGGLRVGAFGSALYLHGKIYRGAFYGAGELTGALEPDPTTLTDSDVSALTDPDGAMPSALIELAGHIGKSLGPIVNLIDVQMVVLAGTAGITNRRFVAAVQQAVTDQLVAIPGRAVRVVRSAWGPEAAARGAAVAAFDAIVAEGQLFGDTDERKIIRTAREVLSREAVPS